MEITATIWCFHYLSDEGFKDKVGNDEGFNDEGFKDKVGKVPAFFFLFFS